MALSAEDQQLIASMEQRELSIKKRQRAANAIFYESRRYRRVLLTLTALVLAVLVAGIFIGIASLHEDWLPQRWQPKLLITVLGAILGALLAQFLPRTRLGRRLFASEERRLNQKYSGDLHAGRQWMQFFYRGEDISYYVPQILYVIESEHRFDSVQAALEYAKQNHQADAQADARGLRRFNAVAAQTNLVALSSVNAHGQPSIRIMHFVKSDRPAVWYMTTAPNTPKVPELDAGKVALTTVPTQDGATISSNDVRIRRAGKNFMDVADLYRAQVPGYLDGMTDEDQRLELVYELTLRSAKVDSWASRDLVSLRELNESADGRLVEQDDVVPRQRREVQSPGLPAGQPRQCGHP